MTDIEKALAAYLGEMCGMRLRPHALTGLAQAAIAAMQPAPQEPVDSAAAVIRDYGDKRYQQAIADVVEWLHMENGLCDCFARSETECACGAWDDYKEWSLERTAQEITRRFGKDA